MNCRNAKMEIALCVGEDLTNADRREELRHHLTGCPECRAHFKRLKGMFRVLELAEEQRTYDSADSLWPGLAGRLGQPRPRLQGPRFNGWVPFSVMAAACILLMVVMETRPTTDTVIGGWVGRNSLLLNFGASGGEEQNLEPAENVERNESLLPLVPNEPRQPEPGVTGRAADRPTSASTF